MLGAMSSTSTNKVNASQHFIRTGAGDALVLLHGFLGGAPMWQAQIDAFSKRFDVIAPELCGYGSNVDLEAADTVPGYAHEVLKLLSHLGVEQFHLMGHSMGGMIVQEMTHLAPERIQSLICFGTGPRGVMPERFEPIEASRARFINDGVPATAREIASKWFVDGDAADGFDLCVELGRHVQRQTALNSLAAMENWDGREYMTSIKQRTLVIWGDRDRSYGWDQPAALWHGIENSSLAVLPDCGHNAHMEQPEIFNALVQNFLPKPANPG